jgi:DNA invertase Pin-like site-specific DNA recombinase
MLAILAGVATWERDIMLERQREGITKARAEGKCKGRPTNIDAAKIKRLAVTIGPAAIAKQLGIARSSVYRLMESAALKHLAQARTIHIRRQLWSNFT